MQLILLLWLLLLLLRLLRLCVSASVCYVHSPPPVLYCAILGPPTEPQRTGFSRPLRSCRSCRF